MLLKLLILFTPLLLATSFYELTVTTLDGKSISAQKLKGKGIAIGIVDGKSPDPVFIKFLDSIQVARPELQVIVFPASDLTTGVYSESAKTAYRIVKSSLLVLKPAGVLADSKDRSDLAKWITTVEKNGHFQVDAVAANSIFVLSKDGELKSVLASGFPQKSLAEALQ